MTRLVELAALEACRALPAAGCSVGRAESDGGSVRTVLEVEGADPGSVRRPDEVHLAPQLAEVEPDADLVVWRWSVDDPGTPDRERERLRASGRCCCVCVPLLVDGRVWGELRCSRRAGEPAFDEGDVAYLEGLAAILAGAVSRADREQSLSDLAFRDPLTGLLNRRAVDEHARRAFDVPRGTQRDVVALAVDINGLKLTNDRHGHPAGDRLLQSVAQELTARFAGLAGAVVARVGGDEFHVLVTGHPVEAVLEVADQMCETSWEENPETSLSCGASAARLRHDTDLTPAELFASADRAQYVAKRERRRRVVVASPLGRVDAS